MLSIKNYLSCWWLDFLGTYSIKTDSILVAWKVYVDESGMHAGSSVAVVACVKARVGLWDEIVPKWIEILNRNNIEFFHASDLNGGYGQYSSWTKERRETFFKELFDIVSKVGVEYLGFVLNPDVYAEEIKNYPNCRLSVYDYLLLHTLTEVNTACLSSFFPQRYKEVDIEEYQANVFVEDGRNLSTGVCSLLESLALRGEYGFIKRIVRENKELIPLQIADMFAYDLFKHSNCNFENMSNIIRKSLKRLDGENKVLGLQINRDYLQFDLPLTVKFVNEMREKHGFTF